MEHGAEMRPSRSSGKGQSQGVPEHLPPYWWWIADRRIWVSLHPIRAENKLKTSVENHHGTVKVCPRRWDYLTKFGAAFENVRTIIG